MFLNHDEEFFYHANNTKLMLFMRINQGFAFKKKINLVIFYYLN